MEIVRSRMDCMLLLTNCKACKRRSMLLGFRFILLKRDRALGKHSYYISLLHPGGFATRNPVLEKAPQPSQLKGFGVVHALQSLGG